MKEIVKKVKAIINIQEINIEVVNGLKPSVALEHQKEISIDIEEVSNDVENLSAKYPMILSKLVHSARLAHTNSLKAQEIIEETPKNKKEILVKQNLVIKHLRKFLNGAQEQNKLLDDLKNGNIDGFLPSSPLSMFVLIPKNALYTIPLDFKKQLIKRSKDKRNSSSTIKYYKQLLQ
jgi:hypothetical protein